MCACLAERFAVSRLAPSRCVAIQACRGPTASVSWRIKVAAQAASALENVRLLEDSVQRANKERRLSEITAKIGCLDQHAQRSANGRRRTRSSPARIRRDAEARQARDRRPRGSAAMTQDPA